MLTLRKVMQDKIPDEFFCPISAEIMIDPVMIEDGHTYERDSIEAWFEKHDTSPLTNVVIKTKQMFPNLALRKLID